MAMFNVYLRDRNIPGFSQSFLKKLIPGKQVAWQVVRSFFVTDDVHSFDTRDLGAGTYFFRVYFSEAAYRTAKIVITGGE